MQRVLCILSSLDAGGAETFIMKIFRGLPKDYKIDFVVSTESGFYEEEAKALGSKIYRVPLRTKHPLKVFKAIKQIVNNYEYASVLKLCDTPIGYFDLLAAKQGGARKICVRSCNASSSRGRIMRIFNGFLQKPFNKIIDVKIAPSKLAAEYTFGEEELLKDNICYLHNGVDLNIYKYNPEGREKIRQEFGILPNQFVVGHIGRFNQQKNHRFLVHVFAEILKKRSDATLMLVGDGEKRKEIESLVKELMIDKNVIFTGVRSDIPDLLSTMDVFVFPSFYEGMPNTIIEAQATGLPCVLSDTITKEAEITDLLTYMPFDNATNVWADSVCDIEISTRRDTKLNFIDAEYNIEKSIERFIEWIF